MSIFEIRIMGTKFGTMGNITWGMFSVPWRRSTFYNARPAPNNRTALESHRIWDSAKDSHLLRGSANSQTVSGDTLLSIWLVISPFPSFDRK